MTTRTNILIRLVRKNGVIANDDKIIVNRSGPNEYSLRYTYGDTQQKKPYFISLDDRKLLQWMRIVIRLLENDADPFTYMQFDFPVMPSVLVDITNLDRAYNTILDAIEFHIDNWPVVSSTTCDCDNTDVYDMPPLIPITPQTSTSRHLFV